MASTKQNHVAGQFTAEEALRVVKQFRAAAADSVKVYDDTVEVYEGLSDALGYSAPKFIAKVMDELYPDHSQRHKLRILDVAAGTGFVGEELHKLGFRQLEALDPSQAMLDVAATKGVYNRLMKEFMTDKKLPLEDKWYDSIVIAGGSDHIPASALNEMIRLVKAGGFILNATRMELMNGDFGGSLTKLAEELKTDGRLKEAARVTFPYYSIDVEGMVLAYQVL